MSSNFSNFPNSFNPNIQQVKHDYNQTIIKPPDRNVTHGTITKHIVIDSRDRDYLKYPDSNQYRVEITEEFRDVTSLELVLAQIPNTFYNISENNNKFYISELNNPLEGIEISEGQYDNELLLQVLNGKNGNLFSNLNNKYNFTQNNNNLKFRIQSNNSTGESFIYNLNYEQNTSCSPCKIQSIDKTIGFLNKTYMSNEIDLSYIDITTITALSTLSEEDYDLFKLTASSATLEILDFRKIFNKGDYFLLESGGTTYSLRVYEIKNDFTLHVENIGTTNPAGLTGEIVNNISVLESPNVYQINNKPYVILKVTEAKRLNSINASNNAYTVIPLLNTGSTIFNQSTTPVHGVIKYFNPPLGKLFWLDIEFLNYDGSLFNFRGQENLLVFEISQLNQPGKYNNFIDRH